MAFVQSCSPTRLTPRIEFSTIIVAELRPGAGVVVPALAGPLPVRRRALPAGRRRARRPPRAPHGALRHDERHVRAQGTFGQTVRIWLESQDISNVAPADARFKCCVSISSFLRRQCRLLEFSDCLHGDHYGDLTILLTFRLQSLSVTHS